ncbi:MAG: universal stress protein [Myxococcales bacterium]|nr:universal stress protein [Myxococcales bacterium]MCB9525488.1 universal stress protein [Myxococcales bacterium]
MAWLPKKTVVVPVDFSDRSMAAVHEALQMVDDPKALHLVHVLLVMHPADPGIIFETVDVKTRQQRVRALLQEKLGEAIGGATIHTPLGSPGAEIVRIAEEIGAELIVMPSHGRTGLSRIALGSVAERVVRLSHCPVLVLRR